METILSKEKIDRYLAELGKEIKREFGKEEIELVLVGGAAIMLNYNFRQSTDDIDAIKYRLSKIKSCIIRIGEKFNLDDKWLNFDVEKTTSFSHELRNKSKFYKKYSNLQIYTVQGIYLVCMKLVAFRDASKDQNDIINICKLHPDFTFNDIDTAMIELYGNWDRVSDDAKLFITHLLPSKRR